MRSRQRLRHAAQMTAPHNFYDNLRPMVRRESNEFWREIVDSLADAVLALSADFDVLGINPAAETLLRASPIGRSFLERLFRRNQWLATMVQRCLGSGQNLNYPETALQLAHREAVVRAEVSPLINVRGETQGVVILLQDLTLQQGTAPGLRADPAAFKLSSAGLAHEVKNPLTGIKGATELLAGMFPDDQRAQQYCGLILDGVKRIGSLVEQVLAARPQRRSRAWWWQWNRLICCARPRPHCSPPPRRAHRRWE